jgi:hypothetical protein
MHVILKRHLHSSQEGLAEVVKKFQIPTEGLDYRAELYRGYEQDNDRARFHRPALGAGTRLYLILRVVPGQKIHDSSRFERRYYPKALYYHLRASLGLPCPHLVQRLMRKRQPLDIEDFDIH